MTSTKDDIVRSLQPAPQPATPGGRRTARRRWLGGAAVLAVVALLAGAGWVVFFSSWLGVREVEVVGTSVVSPAQVRTAADVSPGTPLARVDLAAVQSRVDRIPAVASASVRRSWPHTVVVSVTERRPVATTRALGSWWLVDKTGVRYLKTSAPRPGQPVIALTVQAPPTTLAQAAAVVAALPQSIASATRRVTASSTDSITLRLKSGSEVRWGSPAQSHLKAAVLSVLLAHKAAVYDVSIPAMPATRS